MPNVIVGFYSNSDIKVEGTRRILCAFKQFVSLDCAESFTQGK